MRSTWGMGAVLAGVLVLCSTAAASGDDGDRAWRPVTFSKLVFRIEDRDEIGIASGEYRVFILEELRARGLNAVGAESLVFEKDDSHKAAFVLGGTVTELECRSALGRVLACRLGIDWQVLDVRADEVVYRVTTRAVAYQVHARSAAKVGRELVTDALRSLIRRQRFVSLLSQESRGNARPNYDEAKFQRCDADTRPFPESSGEVLPATLMVDVDGSFGAGFFINREGLALTAAHVVADSQGSIAMRGQDGREYRAHVVRIDRESDVALLSIGDLEKPTPCLALDTAPKRPGAEVYAVGAPASKQLAFSMTKGIISGIPLLDEQPLIQTDASINPGNSGGPLLDNGSRAVGIVSWKIASTLVEGIAFAVPVEVALKRLHVSPHDGVTHWALSGATPVAKVERPRAPVVDDPDPFPSLDPEGDARRQRERAEQERVAAREAALAKITPGYLPWMRLGGLALGTIGIAGVVVTSESFDPETSTRDDFERLRTFNDIAWISAGVGVASFVMSYVLAPTLPDEGEDRAGAAGVRVGLSGPGRLELVGHF